VKRIFEVSTRCWAVPPLLAALLAGCASAPEPYHLETPEQKQAEARREQERRQAEQVRITQQQRRAEQEQKQWQQALAPLSDEQLRFKLQGLEQAIDRGTVGFYILLQEGNGIGALIAQSQVEAKVRERDAVGLELARRGGGSLDPPQSDDGAGDETTRVKSTGTGFYITEDGYLLTACHVVEHAARVAAKTEQGMSILKLVKADPVNDVALLKAEGKFPVLPLAPSGSVKLGESVFTIGFPNPDLQGIAPKLTKGEISSLAGMEDDSREFQISVAVQRGNSGGPVVNQ
jgi:S1-C subfamily serine protease